MTELTLLSVSLLLPSFSMSSFARGPAGQPAMRNLLLRVDGEHSMTHYHSVLGSREIALFS